MTLRILMGAATLGAVLSQAALSEDDLAWAVDGDPEAYGAAVRFDDQFELAQAAQPSSSQRTPALRTASRGARTSRVPYMIGDQSIGLSGALTFRGVDVATIEHPIFGGNRFNAAENSSPLPADRVYVGYRHFANAYESTILDQPSELDVERFDLGFEKTAFDGLVSAELRVPLLRQLDTDLDVFADSFGSSNVPLSDRHGELGNLAVNFKLLLCDRRQFAMTAGVAVNCPTADDARIEQAFDEPDLVLLQTPFVSTVAPTNVALNGRFDNDTVNLVPYLAWQVRPGRFFHQGFLQIDAPANRSDAELQVEGVITPSGSLDDEAFNEFLRGEIDQQTLLRLNLGFGYWLCQGERGGLLRGVAGLFEAHYTTTLDNANPFELPVTELEALGPGVDDVLIDVLAGPLDNNVNQVNLTAGLVANIGNFQVTNGVIVPVTEHEDRSFDFEYSLQVNRLF